MGKEIKHTWHFPKPPQEVWEYLTRPELMEQWLGKADIRPVVGHKFQLAGKDDCLTYCEVVEATPYTRFSYSWQKKSDKNGKLFNSIVVWTLVPKDNGTELHLTHSGFTYSEDLTTHNNGWTLLVPRMVELLNTIEK